MAVVPGCPSHADKPLGEWEIAGAVVHGLFPPRRWAVCPNVSWGMLRWEADVLAVSEAGIIHEVEIKTDKADLLRDADKQKWQYIHAGTPQNRIHRFWYAVPEALIGEADARADAIGSGVISCRRLRNGMIEAVKLRDAKHWPGPAKTDAEEMRRQINRLCSLRFWDRFKQLEPGTHDDVKLALRRAVRGLPEGELKSRLEDFVARRCPGNVLREDDDGSAEADLDR
jgi:hypothetical protein